MVASKLLHRILKFINYANLCKFIQNQWKMPPLLFRNHNRSALEAGTYITHRVIYYSLVRFGLLYSIILLEQCNVSNEAPTLCMFSVISLCGDLLCIAGFISSSFSMLLCLEHFPAALDMSVLLVCCLTSSFYIFLWVFYFLPFFLWQHPSAIPPVQILPIHFFCRSQIKKKKTKHGTSESWKIFYFSFS